ncbi:MAG TPA: hypothetical protein VD966_11045, partial [Pyrinomonadaceae bacterium]|nr:hypothetical protein [Pyrinomonadaceae bacterium]
MGLEVNQTLMDFHLCNRSRVIVALCALFTLAVGLTGAARGQAHHVQQLPAPPPLKFVSSDDRAQLNVVSDVKKRTRLSLDLAESRL